MGKLGIAPALAVSIAALVAAGTGGALAATSGGGSVSACVHKRGGALYQAKQCKPGDRKLS